MIYDVVVIGSGPGGYVAAIRCAQLGLKTACIEKEPVLGGTCLNIGCIPSKTLLHASELYAKLGSEAETLGIDIAKASINFPQMMNNKQSVVKGFNEGVAFLFKKHNVTRYTGMGTLLSPTSIAVGKEKIETKHIILATGSEPARLPFLPFDEKRILSSTGALALDRIPKRLLVVGAGVIGVELGSVYSRLGSDVVFVEFLDRVCPTLDESLSKALHEALLRQRMKFYLSSKVTAANIGTSEIVLSVSVNNVSQLNLSADAVLVAIGRKPYTAGLGLEKVGIVPDAKGFIPVDRDLRTQVPNIFAIGDLIDGPMLAHKASEEGVAAAEIIAGLKPRIEYLAIPNVVYTSPEVASVGLTEAEAKTFGLTYKTGSFPFKANSRARCIGEADGFVRILADTQTDRLLGIHIIGPHASEMINEAALALQHKLTALDIAHTPHAHPTLSEALKEAALAVHNRSLHK